MNKSIFIPIVLLMHGLYCADAVQLPSIQVTITYDKKAARQKFPAELKCKALYELSSPKGSVGNEDLDTTLSCGVRSKETLIHTSDELIVNQFLRQKDWLKLPPLHLCIVVGRGAVTLEKALRLYHKFNKQAHWVDPDSYFCVDSKSAMNTSMRNIIIAIKGKRKSLKKQKEEANRQLDDFFSNDMPHYFEKDFVVPVEGISVGGRRKKCCSTPAQNDRKKFSHQKVDNIQTPFKKADEEKGCDMSKSDNKSDGQVNDEERRILDEGFSLLKGQFDEAFSSVSKIFTKNCDVLERNIVGLEQKLLSVQLNAKAASEQALHNMQKQHDESIKDIEAKHAAELAMARKNRNKSLIVKCMNLTLKIKALALLSFFAVGTAALWALKPSLFLPLTKFICNLLPR